MATKLNPVGHRIIIKPDKIEEEQQLEREHGALAATGFTVVKPGQQEKREKRAVTTGVVVAVGPDAWKVFKAEVPWAKVGDKVEFARYAGELIYHPDTKEELFVMNDEDILVIHEEAQDAA